MKPLPILLLLAALTGCITEKRRAKICQTCPTRIERTVRDSIVKRDSLITIPGEVLRDTIRIECDERNKPVISIKRPVNGKVVRMEVTRPDVNTIISECVVDSQTVVIRWNEVHRTESETNVLPPIIYGVKWQFALVASILCLIVGYIYGAHKSKGSI